MGKKITQLATITEVADDDLIVGVDVSDTSGSDNGTNKKFTKATLLDGLAPLNPQLTGWNPDAETWIYHSVDDPTGYFKIEGKDVSANYSVGWRIMFTNGGNVIKGIITAITYSDPDTIITFLHEIDPTDNQALYLLTNSAITENYFSPHKAPLGFPLSPVKWSVELSSTTDGIQSSPTANTWYNISSLSLDIPVGVWQVYYNLGAFATRTTNGWSDVWATLSTGNNTETDSEMTAYLRVQGAYATELNVLGILTRQKYFNLSTKDTYYLNLKTSATGIANIRFFGRNSNVIVRATCAYL